MRVHDSGVQHLTFYEETNHRRLLMDVRSEKLWRPTSVGLIINEQNELLVSTHEVERVRNGEVVKKEKPDLIKGGVEWQEDFVSAARREAKEEANLFLPAYHPIEFIGWALVPFDSDNSPKYEETQGKVYGFSVVRVSNNVFVTPGEHNVISLEWKKDPWNHFKKGSKKHTLLLNKKIQEHIVERALAA